MAQGPSRRGFLKSAAIAVVAGGTHVFASPCKAAAGFVAPSERPVFGFIGAGIRHDSLLPASLPFAACAAICDVDGTHLRQAKEKFDSQYLDNGLAPPTLSLGEDYRHLLDRQDIDAVVIATPDHWHAKTAIEALRAGKDVYCEKPLTLTIDEGKQIQKVLQETGRVMQVGTQQRSGVRFQTAVALVRAGRIGKLKRVTCGIGSYESCGELPSIAPPSELNWNRWLGPAPWVDYRAGDSPEVLDYWRRYPPSRCHGHFRWWYEYAGGKLTDWGAHHVDIAMWALEKSDASMGQFSMDPIRFEHPVPFENGLPTLDDRYNTATAFDLLARFNDGVELRITDNADDLKFGSGIMFEGDQGRLFVNRGKITGKPFQDLATNPLPEDARDQIYPEMAGTELKPAGETGHESNTVLHMSNFASCIKSRKTPLSDVASHHRHLTICHAANLAMRLDRKLTFDPTTEQFVDDAQANGMLARPSRKGFEIDA